MQRRAAAIYFVFFLVIGAGAFGYMSVAGAQPPAVSLEDPAYTVSDGELFTVDGREYTLAEITAESTEEGEIERDGTLEWTNESGANATTEEVNIASGTNATLNGQTYLVYMPDNSTAQLTANYENYAADLDRQAYFSERMNGFWGVTIVGFLAAIILLAAAYLPIKD